MVVVVKAESYISSWIYGFEFSGLLSPMGFSQAKNAGGFGGFLYEHLPTERAIGAWSPTYKVDSYH